MKNLSTLFGVCLFALFSAAAQAQHSSSITLKGRAVTEHRVPVDYATVLLVSQADTTKVYGAITDEKGSFSVQMPKGNYRMEFSFIGYDKLKRELTLTADTNLGEVVMAPSTVMLDEVVVTGNLVTREADRFVVNVAASPLAAGKSSKEMLAISPGVWITDKGDLSVNGRSGTQVIIDDRILQMSGEELVNYLENIRAEDILKIEIIPYAGAEYEANATGGVIKITLKKQREEGLEGSVGMNYRTSIVNHHHWSISPSVNLKYKRNALSLYGKTNFWRNKWLGTVNQQDQFLNRDRQTRSISTMTNFFDQVDGQIGAVYDINDKQSVGLELNITNSNRNAQTIGSGVSSQNGFDTLNRNQSSMGFNYKLYNVVGNYKLKLDTLGSTFKAIASYTYRNRDEYGQALNQYTAGEWMFDTLYRNSPNTTYIMYQFRSDFDIVLSKTSKLSTGLYYSRNSMDNTDPYESYRFDEELWRPMPERSSINRYTENIAALYATYSTKFRNNISLTVGLRGEYTYAVPATNSTAVTEKQNYFGLFPNANLSIPLNKSQSHTLIVGYGRKIRRPSFWQLNPFRMQISSYAYNEGNPKLQPAYTNDYNLSWVISRKYTITVGVQSVSDAFASVVRSDPNDPNILIMRTENVSNSSNAYVSVSIPAQITKWWMLNANLNGRYLNNRIEERRLENYNFRGNLSTSFSFWKNYNFIVEAFYMSPFLEGNYKIKPNYQLNAGLKGNFLDKRLTASVYVNNFTNTCGPVLTLDDNNLTSRITQTGNYRTLALSIRYNFKAGKQVKVKTVDSVGEGSD